jgi:site-specific DNA recombinase
MRAALYIRVSTEEQGKEGYSIESQTAVCKRWVAEKNHDLVEVYVDEGHSSKTLKRPDMQRMIRDIERKKFDVLVFWRLNRITRTVKDKVFLFDMFDQYGVSLKSMTEEIDTTTASGRMVTNLLVSVAQGEREQTAENVHSTMMELSMDGNRQGGARPFGYDLVDGKLFINEEEAEAVRMIYHMYANHLAGFREIAVSINRNEKFGDKLFNYSTVRYVLLNPVYIGKLRWNYRKSGGKVTGNEIVSMGPHEPIVEQEVWERVNAEIRSRKTGGKVATSEYAFAGILRCARCKRAMTGFSAAKKNGRHRYYRCTGRAQYGNCTMPILKDEYIQEAFLNALDYDPKQLRKFANVNMNKSVTDRQKHIERLKKELESIQKRKKKWQIAYASDALTLEELKDRTKEDKEQEEMIQKELQSIPDSSTPKLSKEQIMEHLILVRDLWQHSQNEKVKKAFIRDVFESITVNTDTERGQGYPGKTINVHVVDFKFRF